MLFKPAILFCWCHLDFLSFRRLIPEVISWSSPNFAANFATCSMVTHIYKIRWEFGALPKNFGSPKHQNFGAVSDTFAIWWLCLERDLISSDEKWHYKLQFTPAHAYLILWTWFTATHGSKIVPEFRLTQRSAITLGIGTHLTSS